MHIALMAAGAIGGYLGARLADGGHDVSLVARGQHQDAIVTNGLSVESPLGNSVLRPKIATSDPGEIGPVDVVIFAVKLWDTEIAGKLCAPLLGPDTVVIPFQNGVETTNRLAGVMPAKHVMAGVGYISASITAPGHILHKGDFASFLVGNPAGDAPPMLENFVDACMASNVTVTLVGDIEAQLWKKLVFFSAMSGLTAAARTNLGAIREDEAMFKTFCAAMEETAAVGGKIGVALASDTVANLLETISGMPPATRATMANDLDAGNRLEAQWLSGAVSRMGAECGVPTPVNDTLYAAVRPYVDGG